VALGPSVRLGWGWGWGWGRRQATARVPCRVVGSRQGPSAVLGGTWMSALFFGVPQGGNQSVDQWPVHGTPTLEKKTTNETVMRISVLFACLRAILFRSTNNIFLL